MFVCLDSCTEKCIEECRLILLPEALDYRHQNHPLCEWRSGDLVMFPSHCTYILSLCKLWRAVSVSLRMFYYLLCDNHFVLLVCQKDH